MALFKINQRFIFLKKMNKNKFKNTLKNKKMPIINF